jgi:hydroxypyruvate isomerase
MSCPERDHIILALALAANEGNIAAEDFKLAASEGERQDARKSVEAARNYCIALRARILSHCAQHGCRKRTFIQRGHRKLLFRALVPTGVFLGFPVRAVADLSLR